MINLPSLFCVCDYWFSLSACVSSRKHRFPNDNGCINDNNGDNKNNCSKYHENDVSNNYNGGDNCFNDDDWV